MSVPEIAWLLGYTIATEIGDIHRFSSPKKLCGNGCVRPAVYQSVGKGPPRSAHPHGAEAAALGADGGYTSRSSPPDLPRRLPGQ